VARLIHLNGPPGIGKSTVARRYAAEHPGTLNLDIDVLRTMVGGWQQDFTRAGELIRPAALAAITAYLAQGSDVVLPQFIARPSELARFRAAATSAGSDHVHVVLTCSRREMLRRFHSRAAGAGAHDPTAVTAGYVRDHGGAALMRASYDAVVDLAAADRDALTVDAAAGGPDATYAAVLAVLD